MLLKLNYRACPLPVYTIFGPRHNLFSDGRLAVNLGTMAFVYEPRFDGGQAYHHEAYSVPCTEPDPVVLDLQCFPGKVLSRNI